MNWEEIKNSIEIGSTINTVVIQKVSNGIVLKFTNGYNGFLLSRYLSNNKEKSKALFNIINEGDLMDVILVGYNDERQQAVFNLSVFEDARTSVESIEISEELINSRRDYYNSLDKETTKTYRKFLNHLRGDLNNTQETIAYELLQNADDYPNSEYNNKVRITFEIKDEFLLVKHDGQPFNTSNVRAITQILIGDEERQGDTNKTGYKGIGFKSVFRYSDWVYIHSGNYSFRFDKRITGDNYPWEVIPIWTPDQDAIEQIIDFEFFNKPVGFALKISEKDISRIWTFFQHVIENPTVILFLRHIIQIDLKHHSEVHSLEITGENKNLKTIESNNDISKWFTKKYEYQIDDELVIIDLQNEQNTSIPPKYRSFRSPSITFAFRIDEKNQIKKHNTKNDLFSYLPLTRTDFDLPFIINADFIPNLDRTEPLKDLAYNKDILYHAGIYFTDLLCEINEDKLLRFQTLRLLPKFEDENEFLYDFWRGFDEEVIKKKLFYGTDEKPHLLGDLLIDKIGFIDSVLGNDYNLFYPKINLLNSEYSDVGNLERLLKQRYELGTVFGKSDLIELIGDKTFIQWLTIPENNLKLIVFLQSSKDKELTDLLLSESIFLTESNTLNKANCIFNIVPDEITFLSIDRVSTKLNDLINANNIVITFKEFISVIFYKQNILINKDSINKSLDSEIDLLNFWNFIYDNWAEFEKDDEIKKSLINYNVLCNADFNYAINIKVIGTVYLSKEFNPENEIETVVRSLSIKDASFISDKYISELRDSTKWRKIFSNAGAITDLQLLIDDVLPILPGLPDASHFLITEQVYKYWKVQKSLTEIQRKFLKDNLKLKCIDSIYRNVSDCYLTDHYNNNALISSLIPIINLGAQISEDYNKKQDQIAHWKRFFEDELGCIVLIDNNAVFLAKMQMFKKESEIINNERVHFELMISLSSLFKARNVNGLNFDNNELFNGMKLMASDANWYEPDNLHLSDEYKPALNLQIDLEISPSIFFTHSKYNFLKIDKYFLIRLGVNDNFRILRTDIPRALIPDSYRQRIDSSSQKIRQNAVGWASQHRIENHITLNYIQLFSNFTYSDKFWKEVKKKNSIFSTFLFEETIYKYYFGPIGFENYVVFYFKNNPVFPNQIDSLKKTIELFSFSLSKYDSDKELLPKYDFSNFKNKDETKSLEEILGIQSQLSQELCIAILSRINNRISIEEVVQLQLVQILSGYIPSDTEKTGIFMVNEENEWKPISELFIKKEDQFEIDKKYLLHKSFNDLSETFRIMELSENNLILTTIPENPLSTEEISDFFKEKGKFIAFKIDQEKFDIIEKEILDKIDQYKFFEVTSLEKVFPCENPILRIETDFFHNDLDNKIYFKDNWKTNKNAIDFIFQLIQTDRIESKWFENLINRWKDSQILDNLESFGNIPTEWRVEQKIDPKNDKGKILNDDLVSDTLDYIDGLKESEKILFINAIRIKLNLDKGEDLLINSEKVKYYEDRIEQMESELQQLRQPLKEITRGTADSETMGATSDETLQMVRDVLENDEKFDCSGWDNSRFPKTLVRGVLFNQIPIKLIVRSCQAGKLHLMPKEWILLSEPNTFLVLRLSKQNIQVIPNPLKELAESNNIFNINFDLERLTTTGVTALSKAIESSDIKYVGVGFVVDAPRYSRSIELSEIGLYVTTLGTVSAAENDDF